MQILATVNCLGSRHKIGLSSKDSLAFFGHPKAPVKGCRCYELLENWRKYNCSKLPSEMKKARKAHFNVMAVRGMKAIKKQIQDVLALESAQRKQIYLHKLTEKALLKVLPQCKETILKKIGAVNVQFKCDSGKTVNAEIQVNKTDVCNYPNVVFYNPQLVFYIFNLSPHWYEAVYKQGLSVIDGHLVLEINKRTNTACYLDLSGGTGMKKAVIKTDANGEKRLQQSKVKHLEKQNSGLDIKPLTQTICSEEFHRIGLHKSGDLVFHDHPQGFRTEKMLEIIGGEGCSCYKYLKRWREKDPEISQPAENYRLLTSRSFLKILDLLDPFCFSKNYSAEIYLHKLTKKALQKCIGLLWKVPYEPIPEIEFTLHSSYKTTPQLSSHMFIA